MIRSFQCISLFKVGVFQKESAHFRHEEHDATEDEQEHADRLKIVHRVVRVEGYAVERNTIRTLGFLDINTVRVVRTHFVQTIGSATTCSAKNRFSVTPEIR